MVTMLAMKAHGLDHSKVNVHGGACAQATLLAQRAPHHRHTHARHASLRQRTRCGALCIGGGEATAIAIEKC